jgi:hypothetical protein
VIEIPLAGRYHHLVALVDDEDEWVTQWKWYAMARPRTTYVSRSDTLGGRYRVSYLLHRKIMNAPCNKEVDHRLQGCVADRVLVARRRRSAQWRTGARTHPGALTE